MSLPTRLVILLASAAAVSAYSTLHGLATTRLRAAPVMKAPWYMPKKEKDTGDDNYWKPGDEPSAGGFWDGFMQGFQFNDKLNAERDAEKVAAEAAQLAAWEESQQAAQAAEAEEEASDVELGP